MKKKIISLLTVAWLISSGSCYGDLPKIASPVPVSFGPIHVYIDNEDSRYMIDAKKVTFAEYLDLHNEEFTKRLEKRVNAVRKTIVYASIGLIVYYTFPGLHNNISDFTKTSVGFSKNPYSTLSTLSGKLLRNGAWFLTKSFFKTSWACIKFGWNAFKAFVAG